MARLQALERQLKTKHRIKVTNAGLGRLTAWRVSCPGCDLSVWPCRRKVTAVGIANRHSEEAHGGNAVVAIVKA